MDDAPRSSLPDLKGTVDERRTQLDQLRNDGAVTVEWLLRQLDQVLTEWAALETKFDVEKDGHPDY
ncbi:hypothetical protein ACH3VR_01250 [Microbacterium sp. B2969]|uniref:SlyX protein n=1 Tax=Microbacterium alkaliflavum TaxID=3248839 RepID=A0ABW7Q3Z9_9MICO